MNKKHPKKLFQKNYFKKNYFYFLGFSFIILLSYLPTPPLGQDMTQGQFLSRV